jgi:hypothetical protein
MNIETRIFLPVLLAMALFASGCVAPTGGTGGNGGAGNADVFSGTGKLVVQITDQPKLNIQKAVVTVSAVEVHVAGTGNESGWVTVVRRPKTFDLVAIKNVSEYLGENDLPAGRYTQIRLNVDQASVTIDGAAYNLTVPSDKIKLVGSFAIEGNKTTTLTLDFDAESSIHEEGKGNYSMKPAIRILTSAPEAKTDEKGCTESGGNITTGWCCKSAGNFPNLCGIGACGCSPENRHEVRLCNCGEGKCFNGNKCVQIGQS